MAGKSDVASPSTQSPSLQHQGSSKSAHTSGPLRIEPRDLDPHEQQYEGRVRIGSGDESGEDGGNGGIYVAHTLGPDRVGNALRIVRAWNSHDELVAALKDAHPHVCSLTCQSVFTSPDQPRHGPQCIAITAAIAKAEGAKASA